MASVSVIIPAYDAEPFLPRTIQSVLDQTVGDWELVVVDDGSSDRTAEVAAQSARDDSRVRVITQANSGVAAARNRGLAESGAGSEYAIFLDADDLWERDALEVLLRALRGAAHAVGASGLSRIIDSKGEPREPGELEMWGRSRQGVAGRSLVPWPLGAPTTLAVLAYCNRIYTPGQMLIRREALRVAGPFDPGVSPCEDWDMSLRLSRLGDILFVERVTLNWRRHGRNASRQADLLAEKMMSVRRKLLSSSELSAEQRRTAALANLRWAGHLWASARGDDRRVLHGERLEAVRLLGHALGCYFFGSGQPSAR